MIKKSAKIYYLELKMLLILNRTFMIIAMFYSMLMILIRFLLMGLLVYMFQEIQTRLGELHNAMLELLEFLVIHF